MADGKPLIRRIVVVFDRESAKKSEQEFQDSLAKAGEASGKAFLRELRAAFDKRMAELKVMLAQGLIDQKEFKKQTDGAAKAFNTGLIQGLEKARKAGELTEKEFLKLSRTLKRTGDEGASAWARIKGGIVSAGGALAAFFSLRAVGRVVSDLVRLGVAAEETASKFTTTFGSATNEMERFVRSFGRLAGLSRDEARDFTATIGAMARGMGFSTSAAANLAQGVLKLAGDLTSFNNVPIEQTLRAIRSAIVGEREALKTLGVVILESDVQQRAMAESGKANAKALTQQEKAAATLALIQERMGPSLGDLVRTQDSLANKGRSVAAAWKDMKTEFGRLLTSWDGSVPTLNNLSNLLGKIGDNAESILSVTISLTKALLVAGLVLGVTRLTAAIRAATLATSGFLAIWRGALALMGPRGWAILGVAALTGWFERMSKAARDAATETKKAFTEFESGLSSLTDADLEASAKFLANRERQLKAQLEALKKPPEIDSRLVGLQAERAAAHAFVANENEKKAVTAELNDVLARQNALLSERRQRALRPDAKPDELDPERQKELGKELERVLTETAVARLQAEQGLTEVQAREQLRRERLLHDHKERVTATVAELVAAYQGLARAQAVATTLQSGGLPGIQGQLGRGTETTPLHLQPLQIPAGGLPDQKPFAEAFSDPWVDALDRIGSQAQDAMGIFDELSAAWSAAGIFGIVRLALAKIRENIAAAAEELAKAAASLAAGNPAAAALHTKAAAAHKVAAVLWGVAGAAGAGAKAAGFGGGGGSAGGIAAGAGPGSDRASRIDTRPEIHIHIPERIASLVDDKDFQKMVFVGQQNFREKVGNNVKVVVHRGSA